jgi:hypothetical protein
MKTIRLVLLCALVSTLSANAANIAWVSFHPGDDTPSAAAITAGFTQAPDVGYTQLLAANGHTVTRFLTADAPDPALNGFDLVIIGRSVNSGHYELDAETAAWNGITAPMMIMSGYTLRNNRLGFTTGTTIPDTAGPVGLAVNVPSHPIFAGIALDAGNVMVNSFAGIATFNSVTQRGISVNTSPIAPGGTVLATIATVGDPAVNGMVIGEWLAGATMATSPADTLGGRRLVFLSGSREDASPSDKAGIYDLTADGQLMFLNAVNYMASPIPEPSTCVLLGLGALTLLWRWKRS